MKLYCLWWEAMYIANRSSVYSVFRECISPSWGRRILLSPSPNAGAGTVEGSAFEARRIRHQMRGRNTAKGNEEIDIGRRLEAQRLYGNNSCRGGLRHPRKRVRRTKDTKHNNVESPSTPSLDVSCQSAAATSSSGMHESEEMTVHGYFTLKTVGSKVVSCIVSHFFKSCCRVLNTRGRDKCDQQHCGVRENASYGNQKRMRRYSG
jgi:hypothetical protein